MKNLLLLLLLLTVFCSCSESEPITAKVPRKEAIIEHRDGISYSTITQSVHKFDNMYYAIITFDDTQMQVINLTKDSLEIALLNRQLHL